MNLYVLIPAAGSSSRMRGRDKLVEDVFGEPLLRKQARIALTITPDVSVALPAPDHPYSGRRKQAMDGLPVHIEQYAASLYGLGGTVSAHCGTLPADATHLMVLLPDLVDLTANDLSAVIGAATDEPVRAATSSGQAGHPVVFPAQLFPALENCPQDDAGPRAVLQAHPARLVPLPSDAAIKDLDTPEDWAAWRATQSQVSD